MNVLSIDFDYFQNTSVGCLRTCYPNGIDRLNEQSVEEWKNYYSRASSAKQLKAVSLLDDEYDMAKALIQSQSPESTAVVANSHISIYDLICDEMERQGDNRLWISNIDMHHDMFNENPALDCGNWIGHIQDKFPNTRMEWIANPVSREMYGLEEAQFDMIKIGIAAMKVKTFDVVFLCRSDNWLPPHLDSRFTELAECMIDAFPNIEVEQMAMQERMLSSRERGICFER